MLEKDQLLDESLQDTDLLCDNARNLILEYISDVTTESGRRTGSYQHMFYMEWRSTRNDFDGVANIYMLNGFEITNFVSGNSLSAEAIKEIKSYIEDSILERMEPLKE